MELLHQLLVRSHFSVLCTGLSLVVEADHLGDGAQIDVVADVAEKSGGNTPQDSVLALGNFLLGLFVSGLGGFGVDDLMVAREDITSSHVLEHSTSLEEEAARRDLDGNLLHVTEPHEEAWVAGLAVDGEEIKVIVETGEGSADVILLQV